jgi:hypothetical protein
VREDLLSPPELDRVGQVTHHLVDEPIRPARPGQDLDEPLVRADTNDRETHQRYRLELFSTSDRGLHGVLSTRSVRCKWECIWPRAVVWC